MKPMQFKQIDPRRMPWGLTGVAVAALWLTGCASKPPEASATQNLIKEAMQAAAEQRPAVKTPDSVMSALVPAGADRPKVSKRDARFDLVFNNASINQVFEAIAAGSRYSFVVQPGFSNTVAVNLRDVSAIEALEVLRELYGFEYRVSGTRVFVEPPSLQTRIFQVAYPSSKRTGRSDTRVISGSLTSNANNASAGASTAGGSTASEGSQVSTAVDTDFWKELDLALKAIVGDTDGRQIVLSQHSGVLVVKALPKQLREVESFLKSSKLSIERQVMLEAKIVEVVLKDGYESGINWTQLTGAGNHRLSVGADPSKIWVPGSVGRQYGVPNGAIATTVDASTTPATVTPTTMSGLISQPLTDATKGILGLAISTDSFYGLLSFLETQGSVQVLSSPRVAAINNQKAVLRVGTDDFYVTGISTTTTTTANGGSVTTPTITTQPFFSGISLDVTPQIDAEGIVTMHVRPSVSNVSERAHVVNLGNWGSFNLPLASSNVNETDTIVRVQDGYIVAIGGLMHQEQDNTKSQVPFVGDLPVIGNMFKQNSRSMRKSELVFLIKPTVIKGESDWRQDLAQAAARLDDLSFPTHSVRERAGE